MATTRGRTTARRLLQSVLASEWAIRPEWLEQFAGIAMRLEADDPSRLTAEGIRAEIRQALAELSAGRGAQALSLGYGDPLAEGSRATVRDGIAIVPLIGPLYHYASEFDDVCGCTSYERLARDIAAIRANEDSVRAVLLEIDSPGGEVGGCAEAADLIAQLAREMPVAGYSSDLCCSAAYWLGSATGHLTVAKTNLTGSIGVVAAYRAKGKGPALIEIVSSQSPKKRPDVETEAGRAQIQTTVDALAEVFVESVAGFRRISPETVLSDFGQGDVFVGARAVEAGLADRVGSFEDALADLATRATASRRGTPAARGSTTAHQDPHVDTPEQKKPAADAPAPLTAEAVAQSNPEIAAHFRTEGATQECARITGILALADEDNTAVINGAIAEGMSPEATALKIVQAQRAAGPAKGNARRESAAGARHLQALAADEAETDAPAPAAEPETNTDAALAARILTAGKRPAATTR